jgi:hypothetical protein
MSPTPTSSLDLLAACLSDNSDDSAWRAFLDAHAGLLHSLCSDREWLDWLPGWLVCRKRLTQARNAVERMRQEQPGLPDGEVEEYLRNYLRKVFRCGAIAYRREQPRIPTSGCSPWPEPGAPPDRPLLTDDLDRVERWLAEEPLARRVPFRLRWVRALEGLTATEREWLAERAGLTPNELDTRIRQEMDAHPDHQCPLGARFIGGLMGISVPLVDQRVRQVVLRLRQRNQDEEQP